MQYQKESNIICLGDTKQAALYFDSIFPVSFLLKDIINLPVIDNYFRRRINEIDINSKNQNYKQFEEMEPEVQIVLNELLSTTPILTELLVLENLLGHAKTNDIKPFLKQSFQILIATINLIFDSMKLYSKKTA